MICSKNKCTGCFGCVNVCPKNAINMEEDEFGNVYPKIDSKKCINCELCKKICPSLNQNKLNFKLPTKTYAMYSKNNDTRTKSTSGGVATVISKYIIEHNGVVYGAGNLLDNNSFDFYRVNRVEDLYKIQNSKYVHCYIKDKYRRVKEDLENKKTVVFIGTPCQIAGLKLFLMKDYEKLITIDIICHGVPSQKLLFEDLYNNFKIYPDSFEYITFRDSNGFHINIYETTEDYKTKNVILSKYANLDDYYRNFLRGNTYRENCYECYYAKKERISDITIGDFWGLSKDSKIYDDVYKGISSVMVSTKKGQNLINKVFNLFISEERTYEEVCLHNEQLNSPTKKTKQYYIYKNNYALKGYKKTFKKMKTIKDFVKYNPIIYGIFKRKK